MSIRYRRLFATALLVLAAPAHGQMVSYGYCEPIVVPPHEADLPPGQTYVDADRLDAQRGGLSTFTGDVVIRREGRRVLGDRAVYDQPADILTVVGDVRIQTADMLIHGDQAKLWLEKDSGQISDARFRFVPTHGYGTAEMVAIITPDFTHLEQATYTTCDPGEEFWSLRASSIDLDEATNTGEAYNVRLNIRGVPVFYTPYLNFPLAGRKTGFLAPSFGSSDTGGTDLAVPFYWNIAPNRDATITPRYIGNRGTMLSTEFRYLEPGTAGELDLQYLPDDDLYGDDRYFFGWTNRSHWNRWSADLLYQKVSDPELFDDISQLQSRTSQTHLERHLDLTYQGDWWSLLARAQGYQTLTGTEPYQRLPQLLFSAAPPSPRGGLQFGFQGELVRFAHETRDPTGTRVDLLPSVSLPQRGIAWFLTPKLGVRYTSYRLDDAEEETLSRTVPIASLDGGLFFERDLTIGGRNLLQTLEPRLFYLYVPYRDQDELPRFDTGRYGFTFASLFRENRFSGPDRVGDANQLTTAVTTRFLDADSGAELASASIGQIHYFRDREVTLAPNAEPEELSSSNVVGELRAAPAPGWDLTASAVYDPHEDLTEVLTGRVRYHPAVGKNFTLSYRLREPNLKQTDLGFFWPVARHWNVLGRWNYDLLEERNLDQVLGIEYQSCCWSLRLVTRRTLNTTTLEQEDSFMILFELKGLAQIGDRLDQEVERGILGY